VSVPLFIAVYVAGAGLLAVWFDMRFPSLRPASWLRVGVAVAATMAVDELSPYALGLGPHIVGVICVVLPALAATFLVCIWMLRMMRSAMPG
jgi:hypothetical protein